MSVGWFVCDSVKAGESDSKLGTQHLHLTFKVTAAFHRVGLIDWANCNHSEAASTSPSARRLVATTTAS